MKHILVIQSRSRSEMIAAEQGEYGRAIGNSAQTSFVSALDESLAWVTPEKILEGFDAVCITGSGEFDLHSETGLDIETRMVPARAILSRLTPLIMYLLKNNFPTFGVCFGHQLIGEVQGGRVTTDHAQEKVGSFQVILTTEGKRDRLFQSLPESFVGQYGHHNSLSSLPEGATLLANSPQCKFSALLYSSRVYTVQFHPELTQQDVYWKLEHSPGYLPEGKLEDIVKPSPEASTLIPAFIEHVVV